MEFENNQGAIKMAGTATMNKIITKVFKWMFLGLIVSAISAVVSMNLLVSGALPVNMIYVAMLAELILVIVLVARIQKMSAGAASTCFLVYSIMNGLTLAPMLLIYEVGDVSLAFVSAAAMFGAMALIGAKSKKDLSNFGSIGLMLLIGCIITTILNVLIFKSTGLELALLYMGLAIFAGITMYDMQKIKLFAIEAEQSGDETTIRRVVILSALTLYLDFINIFIRLVQLFGRRK